ncbi:Plasmodium exported protein (hyp15), unknown function [Plasmodium sp. gorilla clade G3]|nr:Plasmodium exported protein (hyp15), unknown function [Plasmodium sp. gorilla clade G3]
MLIGVYMILNLLHMSHTSILEYKHERNVWVEKYIFFRSLCEVLKEKNTKTQIIEWDLIYDQLEKQKLQNYNNLLKNTEIDYYYKRKSKREKKLHDKIVRQKMKEYYNMRNKLIIDNSFGTSEYNEIIKHITKPRIKDKLYKMIFKGKSFWKKLSYTMSTLGSVSTICFFIGIIVAYNKVSSLIAPFLGLWGVCVFLLIIIIVGVWFLSTWLWPHKDLYNMKYGE